ncbi:MAG: portal protein [Erysipelotrichia bacterium]|nr:portal protein [Erysipelotrichia bacterium]
MSVITADIFLVVFAGLLGGLLARLLRQPLVLGYILAGIMVGPYTGGATVTNVEHIADLADVGAALLLFSLGLEFKVKDLLPIGRIAFIGSTIQVVLTFILGTLFGKFLGWQLIPSLWLAAAIVSSSTALILKTLSDKGLRRTLSGKIMLGVSIVQDLLVIPIMILLVSLSTNGLELSSLMNPLLSSLAFGLLMGGLAVKVMPWALHHIARLDSHELFMLLIVSIGLGIGYVSHLFGLSLAFGAFVAGLVLSESDYGHKALSEMIPLRDLFGLLFFASIGMLFDPGFVFANITTIVGLVIVITSGKGLILAGVGRAFGYRRIVPLAMFFGMIPISEIAFIIVRTALSINAIDERVYLTILNVVIISMILGPVVAGFSGPVYGFIRRFRPETELKSVNLPETGMTGHVVMTGGSQFSEYLADAMQKQQVSFIVIEPNYQSFFNLAARGLPLLFGEPDRSGILVSAGVERARLLIVAESELVISEQVIGAAHGVNPSLPIILLTNSLEKSSEFAEKPLVQVILLERQVANDIASCAAVNLQDGVDGMFADSGCLKRPR